MKKGKELKPHIGIFGRRNTGKSSLINTLTGQEIAIVSDRPGTTTDPVKKSIEIFGIGPAIIIDTAGIDDSGALGIKRVDRTRTAIRSIDAAILVTDHNTLDAHELELISWFNDFQLPFFILHNKSDQVPMKEDFGKLVRLSTPADVLEFSCMNRKGINALYAQLRKILPESSYRNGSMLGGIVNRGDVVLLVTPIDSEAPEGRMKLPMVMVQRDILDRGGIAIALKETELEAFLDSTNMKPRLAITDGSKFKLVAGMLPDDIPLTSFSIVLAQTRGDFSRYLENTRKLDSLKDGDKVLLLESCTHEVTCDDISRYKLPEQLRKATGKELEFTVINGMEQMDMDMSAYQLVLQCGACVFTRRQLENRLRPAIETGVPVSNYGMALAWMGGILERSVTPFESVIEAVAAR